jgi:hypothetical protein
MYNPEDKPSHTRNIDPHSSDFIYDAMWMSEMPTPTDRQLSGDHPTQPYPQGYPGREFATATVAYVLATDALAVAAFKVTEATVKWGYNHVR